MVDIAALTDDELNRALSNYDAALCRRQTIQDRQSYCGRVVRFDGDRPIVSLGSNNEIPAKQITNGSLGVGDCVALNSRSLSVKGLQSKKFRFKVDHFKPVVGGEVFYIVENRKIRPTSEAFELWLVDSAGTSFIYSASAQLNRGASQLTVVSGEYWTSILHLTSIINVSDGVKSLVIQVNVFDEDTSRPVRRSILVEDQSLTSTVKLQDVGVGEGNPPVNYPAPFDLYPDFLYQIQRSNSLPLYDLIPLSQRDFSRSPDGTGLVILVENPNVGRDIPGADDARASFTDFILNGAEYVTSLHPDRLSANPRFQPGISSGSIFLDYTALGYTAATVIDVSGELTTFGEAAQQPRVMQSRRITVPLGGDDNEDRITILGMRHYLPTPPELVGS